MVADEPIIATGKADISEERSTFIIDKMESLLDLRDRNATQGILSFTEEDNLNDTLNGLIEVLGQFEGNCPVRLQLEISGELVSMLLRDVNEVPVCVSPSEDLCEAVEQLYGRPVLSFL